MGFSKRELLSRLPKVVLLFSHIFWILFFISTALWSSFSHRPDRHIYTKGALFVAGALTLSFFLPSPVKIALRTAMLIGIPLYYLVVPEPPDDRAEKLGIKFDRRSKAEVVFELRNQGEEVYPFVHPSYFVPKGARVNGKTVFPLSAISKVKTVLCNENGYWVIYTSDKFGFRNPQGTWEKRADVFVVGDSFAQGWCVPDGKTMLDILRAETGLRVANTAMAGNEMFLELAGLREYAREVSPKVVLWMYAEANDLWALPRFRKTYLSNYLSPEFSQGLTKIQDKIDSAVKKLLKELERKIPKKQGKMWRISLLFEDIFDLRGLREILRLLQNPPIPDKSFKIARLILEIALTDAKKIGATLLFVYLPDWHRWAIPRYLPFLSFDPKKHRGYERMLEIVDELGIPKLDITEVFERYPDPLTFFPFGLFGHYNEGGHKVVGKALAQKVMSLLR